MRVILSAGHKNTDGGGASRESDWTYPACVAIRDELVRRGHEAWIIQEHDGDTRPDTSVGRGLQNVARLCVDLANAVGGNIDVYFSQHYQGTGQVPGPQGAFGIYPDATGDSADINPTDIKVAKAVAERVARTGMGLYGDGTMSEKATYVGSQGFRLGEMVGTLGFRDRTARVVFEAGNYSNPGNRALLWDSHWRSVLYPRAVVDGLESVFGAGKGEPVEPVDPAKPVEPGYAKPVKIPTVEADRPLIVLDNGAILTRLDEAIVQAVRATPRLQTAEPKGKHIGPVIPSGTTFAVDYLIINPDKSLYFLTPWWSRVRFEDCKIIQD